MRAPAGPTSSSLDEDDDSVDESESCPVWKKRDIASICACSSRCKDTVGSGMKTCSFDARDVDEGNEAGVDPAQGASSRSVLLVLRWDVDGDRFDR